ncbi:MAG: molybdate ABC transporter substrate-binding protein, partial [Ewingella sp.]|nr:molybdate ABC transporter substrate-binding protein [Ewingella sp.]
MSTSWGKLIAGSVLVAGLAAQAQAADKVTVFAAASLTNAMQDIAAQYQKEKSVQVVSSF